MDDSRKLLCHFLAAIAYRLQKALRGAPDSFSLFSPGSRVRTPKELVRHISSVLGYARTFFTGGAYQPEPLEGMTDEVQRFHALIEDLAVRIDRGDPLDGITYAQLLQGPFSDAMTHVGQIALLRRLADNPVAPENFIFADIKSNRLGPDQPLPACPDSVWNESP